jgi:HlyD family secretion protein
MLLIGVLLWAGLWPFGSQAPLAGQRQDDEFTWRAEVQPPRGSEEICSRVEQPMTILFIAPQGKTVKKGDLLVELDTSGLTDERIRQTLQTRKAESEMVLAQESEAREKRAASGQVVLAEKALHLAQNQLKAFTEGEYSGQLALAEGAAAIARQKRLMMEYRVTQLRASAKDSNDPARIDALQEADIAWREAVMQATEADNSLALLKSFIHDNKVAELELAVAQREFDLVSAKDALNTATVRGNADRSLAEMSFEIERARLTRLDDQIGKSKICAPRDGTIIYPNDPDEEPIRPGVVVHERQVLIHLLPVPQPKP